MKKSLLLIFVFILFSCGADDDNLIINVSGKVRHAYKNNPIQGITIYIYDDSRPILSLSKSGSDNCISNAIICTTTDALGNYSLSLPDDPSYGLLRVACIVPENFRTEGGNGDFIGQIENGASNSIVNFWLVEN